jgi:hypothetical protein
VQHRPAAEVCHACKEHIKLGKQAIEESKKTGPGNVWVRGFGRLYVYRGRIGWIGDSGHRDIADVLVKLFKTIAVPSEARDYSIDEPVITIDVRRAANNHSDRDSDWHQPDVQVPAEFLDAFRELYVDLHHVLAHVYEEGKVDGSNMLRQLATGEMSVEDMNAETARAEGLTYKPFRGTAAKELRKKKAKKKTKKKAKKKRKKT